MNILILEDTSTFVEEFVGILKNNNLFTDAHFFCLGDHFEKIDDTKDYQVIFIDVHLSDKQGLKYPANFDVVHQILTVNL